MFSRLLTISTLFAVLAGTALPQAPAPVASQPILEFARVTAATPLPNGLELRDGALLLRITALREDVIRIRGSRTGVLPEDASWAVLPQARRASAPVTQQSDARMAGFKTSALQVAIDRATGLLTISDSAGHILQQDAEPIRFQGTRFRLAKTMPADEHYFGLGDKTGAFDHRDAAFRMWNTDAYAWQESTDPLYKDIPFYLTYRAGTSLGVLLDNTWPCSFDFGRTLTDEFEYRAENGPLDMYLLAGPSAKDVLKNYAWLTGPTPLPPLWALGFQQSRYSYMTQERVLEVAAKLRADKIPADAIYLDVDYQHKNWPFTISKTAFPDMAGMIRQLHQEKFHVVAITDLHIADQPDQHYAPFDTGTAGNDFVKSPDGSLFVGKVWPGPSVFPDFTAHGAREWWGSLYKGFVGLGIDGFWNDMNEPSVFNDLKTMPKDVVHQIEEPGFARRSATHEEIHNVYGMENSRATRDGLLRFEPDKRPFVLTRASYAGGQRYAATWTGDDSATWNHLRLTTSMLKNLGLSGFSLAGADVGGYAGTPSPELLTKWIEIGAFQPIDRDHAEKGTGDHEPWAGGPEQEAIRRRFIDERYRLLPYLYTTMESNSRSGLPLLRPLFLEFPDAAPDHHPLDVDVQNGGEFMVGPDLLVAAPPFFDKMDDYNVNLPGPGWYDYWTGLPATAPGKRVVAQGLQPEAAEGAVLPAVHVHPELAVLPVFVRPGSILPVAPLTQNTEDKPQGPLTLRVFPGPHCHGSLYQDDGETFAYRKGDFLKLEFTCKISSASQTAQVHIGRHEGRFPAWWKQIRVEVNGLPSATQSVVVNGHAGHLENRNAKAVVVADDAGNGVDVLMR
jgi:alpha-glucosidase